MPWNTPSTDDVLDEFTPAEKTTINAIQGATTNLANILSRVVNAWRGAILAGGNQVAAVGTVPDQVLEDVIADTRWRWLTSLPSLKQLQTDGRKALYESANDTRKEIARGDLKVEIPETALASPTPGNAVEVVRTGRSVKTTSFDGLSSS